MILFQNDELFYKAKEILKKIRILAIAVASLMIICGIVIFFLPETAPVIALWLTVFGTLIYGIINIVLYAKMPKEIRDGWDLALGIIWIVIGLFLASGAFWADAITKLIAWGTFEIVVAFMVAFTCLFSGIRAFSLCSVIKALNGSVAGAVISGILLIIAAIVILLYPIGSIITLTVFYGLFLVIAGVALFCRAVSV